MGPCLLVCDRKNRAAWTPEPWRSAKAGTQFLVATGWGEGDQAPLTTLPRDTSFFENKWQRHLG